MAKMSESGPWSMDRVNIGRKGNFVEIEDSVRNFYHSNELATTVNYVFPSFNVALILKDSESKGIGLFLEERAVPGQLLILGNAISSCQLMICQNTPYKTDRSVLAQKEIITRLPSLCAPRIPPAVHQRLHQSLEETITRSDIDLRAQINMLDSHQSPGQPGETSHEISKRRLLQAIREMNLQDSEGDKVHVPDFEELKEIVSNNAMCDTVSSVNLNAQPSQVETCERWGLWLLPSWINHSCSPNCHRMRIGDAMIIRAAMEIATGEELTLPYFDIFQPLALRDINCNQFGFRCECPRCTFERSIGKSYEAIADEHYEITKQLRNCVENEAIEGATQLLIRLFDLSIPLESLIKHLKWKFEEGVLPQVTSADVFEYWIRASFIDFHIAGYSLCVSGYFRFQERSHPYGRLVRWRETPTSEGEDVTFSLRVVFAIEGILSIVKQVHPGSTLGQKYHSILLKEFLEFVRIDLIVANLQSNFRRLEMLRSNAYAFFVSYYGPFAGTDTFGLLMLAMS